MNECQRDSALEIEIWNWKWKFSCGVQIAILASHVLSLSYQLIESKREMSISREDPTVTVTISTITQTPQRIHSPNSHRPPTFKKRLPGHYGSIIAKRRLSARTFLRARRVLLPEFIKAEEAAITSAAVTPPSNNNNPNQTTDLAL
jgi:hypothetical protein